MQLKPNGHMQLTGEACTLHGRDLVRSDAPWKILVVDDDQDVRESTRFALAGQTILGRRLECVFAGSAAEGRERLGQHGDTAAILLDVVMEQHDSGLQLVRWMRKNGFNNARVILRTGEAGYAPELDVVRDYDINDYRAKGEFTYTRLITSLTAALRSFEQIETINRLAYRDAATDLPNRNQLIQDIATQASLPCRVALLRIGNFGETVIAFGEPLAKQLLRAVASALATLSGGRPVYQYGEDTLGIVIAPDTDQEAIMSDLSLRRYSVHGKSLRVQIFMGSAVLESGEADTQVCTQAYTALQYAILTNANEPVRFAESMSERARHRLQLVERLRKALDHEALAIAFQPIVDLKTGRMVGAEALARWQEEGASISPAEFIPIAEQSGLSLEIFALGVRRAAAWLLSGNQAATDTYVAVNLSACDLERPDLAPFVIGLLNEVGLKPANLQIETTETALTNDMEGSRNNLAMLRSMGCRVAVDGIGTGYSSLSSITRLPIDVLNLDCLFVQSVTTDHAANATAALTLELAHRTGISVVAKGVETQAQRDALLAIGYTRGQGFLFGRAMPTDQLIALIEH